MNLFLLTSFNPKFMKLCCCFPAYKAEHIAIANKA